VIYIIHSTLVLSICIQKSYCVRADCYAAKGKNGDSTELFYCEN